MLDKPLLYLRTARQLRLRQLVWQIARRAPVLSSKKHESADLNPGTTDRLKVALGELLPEADIAQAEETVAGRFRFLNHTEFLPTIDWRRRYVSHLWSYNLHYFDYALNLALAYRKTGEVRHLDAFEQLVSEWIAANKVRKGDGWEPYTTAVRSVNWMYSFLLIGDSLRTPVRDALLMSIVRQLSHLERRIEWHLMGNHLLQDLKALFVGGLLFDGIAAERWRRVTRKHLWDQVTEQILDDGGHFELTPMYHALVFKDLLEVVHLARAAGENVPADVLESIPLMARATGRFFLADGSLHLFSDSAQGIAPSLRHLNRLSTAVVGSPVERATGSWALPQTGYYGFTDQGADIFIDCGTVGASYQPGHGHADALSYELTIKGHPIVVDSGVHGYDDDPYREYVRSTPAHNTVTIDGKDQSEMWATFRVARRARILGAAQSWEEGTYRFEGAYQPYHDTDCSHQRRIAFQPGSFSVIDTVTGAKGKRIDSFIHLHPDLSVTPRDTHFSITGPAGSFRLTTFGSDISAILRASVEPVQGFYCPEFGKAISQTIIVLRKIKNDGREFGYTIEWTAD